MSTLSQPDKNLKKSKRKKGIITDEIEEIKLEEDSPKDNIRKQKPAPKEPEKQAETVTTFSPPDTKTDNPISKFKREEPKPKKEDPIEKFSSIESVSKLDPINKKEDDNPFGIKKSKPAEVQKIEPPKEEPAKPKEAPNNFMDDLDSSFADSKQSDDDRYKYS